VTKFHTHTIPQAFLAKELVNYIILLTSKNKFERENNARNTEEAL
jgi:hypothetical protein